MKPNIKTERLCRSTLFVFMTTILVSCSAMQPTSYGFNGHSNGAPINTTNVLWKLSENNNLSNDEKEEIDRYVTQLINEKREQLEDNNLIIQAQITRIEVVNPFLNTVSTIFLFLPFDRGGAAIELQATESDTGQIRLYDSYAKWMPKTEFSAHFSRLELAKLALQESIDEFFQAINKKTSESRGH